MNLFESTRSGLRDGVRVRREPEPVWRAVQLALPLSLAGVLWMQVFHALEGASERAEPPFVLHWLRDSALAFPAVASPSSPASGLRHACRAVRA